VLGGAIVFACQSGTGGDSSRSQMVVVVPATALALDPLEGPHLADHKAKLAQHATGRGVPVLRVLESAYPKPLTAWMLVVLILAPAMSTRALRGVPSPRPHVRMEV
jgi:hypothetical protein